MRTTRRYAKYAAMAAVVLPLLLAGCAKPPQADLDAARTAVEAARSAGAADYAPESLRQAEDTLAQLETELQAQAQKASFTRSYKETARLALATRRAGEQAVTDAASGKETARTEAQSLMAEAQAALDSARTLLSSAPAGKGSQSEIEAMKSDLTGAQTALGEAQSAYEAGRFSEAHTKAEAAKSAAGQIIHDVTSAKALQRGGRS